MKIRCSGCGKVVKVTGRIWQFRLDPLRREQKLDEQGNYLGWNCDNCADAIEYGSEY
jgi:hypothetical protein